MIKGYLRQWMIKSENCAVKDIIHCKQRAMTLEMSWMHLKKLHDFGTKTLEGELLMGSSVNFWWWWILQREKVEGQIIWQCILWGNHKWWLCCKIYYIASESNVIGYEIRYTLKVRWFHCQNIRWEASWWRAQSVFGSNEFHREQWLVRGEAGCLNIIAHLQLTIQMSMGCVSKELTLSG